MTDDSLRARVLELLARDGKPVSVREVARRLDLDADARRELKPVLRRLLEDGEVVKIRGTRIGLPSRMNLVVGRLTCNPAGFGFVVPENRRPGQPDVYVSAVNLKEALHGDRVVARVERMTPKGPEGRIIRVLERGLQRMVGRCEQDGRFGGHVVPFDRRVLHELFIPAGDEGGAKAGEMVLAEITRPPTATRNPIGRVLQVLGVITDPGVDLKVIMAKYGLPDAFPPEVEAEAERVPNAVRPEDVGARTDFRPWATVTVDPETARDHDDAISLDRLPNGHWRLAVHIADVAHYVHEGTALDQEAYLRGRVVPMLPHALSSHICSLVEGQDRLTQSVVLEVDARGQVRKADFHDGVIKSAARMTYQEVQKIVDGEGELRARYAALVPLFERMDELARIMRKRRYERGSLDFDLPEPKLVLGPRGEMTGIVAHERLDSMRVIEEFMLAANEAVAERLHKAGVGALYRIHERPDPERVLEFCELVASFGYRVPGNLQEIRPEDFQLILRLARYHEENLGHFGLATDMYAHFTSPIRRYPDLVVHRALRALRTGKDAEREAWLKEVLPEMGRHLSEMERRASEAERGLVHVSSMTDDYYLFNEKAHVLKGENTKKTYRLGDKVEVQVVRVDLERRQIDFALVDVLERTARAGAAPKRPPTGRRGAGGGGRGPTGGKRRRR